MRKYVVFSVIFISCHTCLLHAQNNFNPFRNFAADKSIVHALKEKEFIYCSAKNKNNLTCNRIPGDTTEESSINLIDGSLLKDVKLTGTDDSVFSVTKSNLSRSFPISKIHKITFTHHGFWTGFTVGAAGSMAAWTLLGIASSHDNSNSISWGIIIGLILAVPTGLISGMISEFAVNDDIYNFSTVNPEVKSKWLRRIIEEHKE